MYDQVSGQIAGNRRKIVQLVLAVVGSLTIKISRGEVFEHVQKPAATIEDRWRSHTGLTWSYDGRTTSGGRSCMIVGDRGTLQSYDWSCDQSCDQSCDHTTGAATSCDFQRSILGVHIGGMVLESFLAAGRAISRGPPRFVARLAATSRSQSRDQSWQATTGLAIDLIQS
jgi:hypothetical protein